MKQQHGTKACGAKSARVALLAGQPPLIMRCLGPLEMANGELATWDAEEAVNSAVENFTDKGLKHDESPQQTQSTEARLFLDFGRVSEEQDRAVAVADLLSQLHLTQLCWTSRYSHFTV